MKNKNISGEDIMFAILDQKDSKFTIEINRQLYTHLTPTEAVDIMEEAVQQFTGLYGKIIDDNITVFKGRFSFTFVVYSHVAELIINGIKE